MILGDRCTRACRFCATLTGRPLPPEPEEPEKVARSIRLMELKHCVITSVDRDDLPDKGAGHWAATIRAIRAANPDVVIEVLIPDYRGEELRTCIRGAAGHCRPQSGNRAPPDAVYPQQGDV